MNILFVCHNGISTNSGLHVACVASCIRELGVNVAVAVPDDDNKHEGNEAFSFPLLSWSDAAQYQFQDGCGPDLIHAWTPRQRVSAVTRKLAKAHGSPYIVHLEDNEDAITAAFLGLTIAGLRTAARYKEKLEVPSFLSHPVDMQDFIEKSSGVTVLIDSLFDFKPASIPGLEFWPAAENRIFKPMKRDRALWQQLGLGESTRVVVYHGNVHAANLLEVRSLYQALDDLCRSGMDIALVRLGRDDVEITSPDFNCPVLRVIQVPFQPRENIPAYLSLADVLVQPGKVDDFNGYRFPSKLPEFFAMGVPVVLPRANLGRYVVDGVDGILLECGDSLEIAEKVRRILGDPVLHHQLAVGARNFYEKNMDWSRSASKVVAFYSNITNSNLRAAALLADYRRNEVEKKDKKIAELSDSNDQLVMQVAELQESLANAVLTHDLYVQAVNDSTSWRLTSPVRWIGAQRLRAQTATRLLKTVRERHGGIAGAARRVIEILQQSGVDGLHQSAKSIMAATPAESYVEWVRRYDSLDETARNGLSQRLSSMRLKPLISIVMPTYNPNPLWLAKAIESVQLQIYPFWELCIADDASPDPACREVLLRFAAQDERIKVVYREKNGHISAASNSALALATGEWTALMDHDDMLPEHALFWVADAINAHPDVRLIYSDEDKIDSEGNRSSPYFKSDWNMDLFYSQNMFSHLGVFDTALLREVGGFRLGMEGSQDYDLVLRCIERIAPAQVVHIPRVLYHWRVHAESTAGSAEAKPYAQLAGERALNEHFQRTGTKGRVEFLGYGYRVHYDLPVPAPLVSLIIPTRNAAALVRQCVESIEALTNYPNYEIIIVDNGSDEADAIEYFDSLSRRARFKLIRDDSEFNYSALNNNAVAQASGEFVGLVNNDIEVISPDWLLEMVSIALQPGIGAVGAKLWYPDRTLQHGGVVLGVGGVASHSHKGLPSGNHGYFGRADLIQSFSAVTAACLIVRKANYEAIGGLDEINLKVAFNDVDFCLRLRERGLRNVWTPYAELFHHESATRGTDAAPEKQDRFNREVDYMKKTWGALLLSDPAYNPNLTLGQDDFSLAWPPRI